MRLKLIRVDSNSKNSVVGKKPNFKRLQLIPARGNKPHLTTIRKLSCPEIKSAIGGE